MWVYRLVSSSNIKQMVSVASVECDICVCDVGIPHIGSMSNANL
jgi:hypothetical protein